MPPPTKQFRNSWASSISLYPSLRDKWGDQVPVDSQGNTNIDAVKDVINLKKGGQIKGIPSLPTPETQGLPSYPTASDLKPVDWWRRFKDIGSVLPTIGPAVGAVSGFEKFIRSDEPPPSFEEQKGPLKRVWEGTGIPQAISSYEEISSPARGYGYSKVAPHLRTIGLSSYDPEMSPTGDYSERVEEAYQALLREGVGPFRARQGAAEWAEDAGVIPFSERLGIGIGTDPLTVADLGTTGFIRRGVPQLASQLLRRPSATGITKEVLKTPLGGESLISPGVKYERFTGKPPRYDTQTGKLIDEADEAATTTAATDPVTGARVAGETTITHPQSGDIIETYGFSHRYGDEIPTDLQQQWYEIEAGLDPFKAGRKDQYRYRSGHHVEAAQDAMNEGWVVGDISKRNMDIARKHADRADALDANNIDVAPRVPEIFIIELSTPRGSTLLGTSDLQAFAARRTAAARGAEEVIEQPATLPPLREGVDVPKFQEIPKEDWTQSGGFWPTSVKLTDKGTIVDSTASPAAIATRGLGSIFLDKNPVEVTDLPSFDEINNIIFKDDIWRKLANKRGIRSFMSKFNPSAVPKDDLDKAKFIKAALDDQVDTKTKIIMSQLRQIGTQGEVFGKLTNEGFLAEGPLKGIAVNAIRTYPKKYMNRLNDKQKAWIQVADKIEKGKLAYLEKNGIKINKLAFDEGGSYAGRRVWGRVNSDAEVFEFTSFGRGKVGSKMSSEKERVYKNITDAIKDGFKYLPEDETLLLNVQSAYRRVINEQYMKWIESNELVKLRRTGQPENLRKIVEQAKNNLDRAKKAVPALNRAIQGQQLPTGTVNSIETLFPDFKGRLREPTRISIENVLRAAKKLEEPERVFDVPKPGAVKKLEKLIKEAAEQLEANPNDPELQGNIDRLNRSLGFIKFRLKLGEPYTVPHSPVKELRKEAREELKEVINTIRGRKVKRGTKYTYEGGLIDEYEKKLKDAQREARRAATIAGRKGYTEGTVPLAPFSQRIFEKTTLKQFPSNKEEVLEGREIADRIIKDLSPQLKNTLISKIEKPLDVSRAFMLGADISSLLIQLLFLTGYPGTYYKAVKGFANAFRDPAFLSRYYSRPENIAIVNKYPGIKITSSGGTDMTQAASGQGLLARDHPLFREGEAIGKRAALMGPRAFGTAAGKLYRPFARGYEASLDVAGIEMLKMLDHLGTTPARIEEIAQFVNKFRGITSSARLGVTAGHRQAESVATLAPMYNRAIAALLFDLFHGGLPSELVWKGMARGVTAIAALTVAISLAKGETIEEAVNHLTPMKRDGKWFKNNPDFITWDIAGQRVGPGSKVRSVITLLSRSMADPENLKVLPWGDVDYMKNPIMKFGRGLVSPAVSGPWDLLTGEDFIGDPTRDGVLQFTETVSKRFMPIWISSTTFEGGNPIERTARGISEVGGLRAHQEPLWVKQQDIRDQMVMNTFGGGDHLHQQSDIAGKAGRASGVPYTTKSEIDKLPDRITLWQQVENDPKNKSLIEEIETLEERKPPPRTGMEKLMTRLGELKEKRNSREKNLVSEYLPRLDNPASRKVNNPYEFRQQLKISNAMYLQSIVESEEIAGQYDSSVSKWLGDRVPDRIKDPQKWTVFRYYKILNESKNQYGKLDFDKFGTSWKAEQDSWGEDSGLEELFELYQKYRLGSHDKITESYYNDNDILSNAGYWKVDFPEITSEFQKFYPDINVEEIWKEYLSSDSPNKSRMEKDPDIRVRNIIKSLKSFREEHRNRIRQTNLDVDRIRVKWYRQKPLHPQNNVLWNQLYVGK